MKNQLAFLTAGLTVTILFAPSRTSAVCDQTSASQADIDYWNVHGCWWDFINYHYQAYDLEQEDWGNRGFNDACNMFKEYPKHWSAADLLEFGLPDDNFGSFHGTLDYKQTARKYDTVFHDDIFHTATDNPNVVGQFQPHPFGADEVRTSCQVYSAALPGANPATRAASFMHEGWHAWEYKYDYWDSSNGGHFTQQGNCGAQACDWFYFHNVSAYVFGAMWENDGTANRFHSPNQVQVEFLCDVADFSQPWVPMSVRQTAASNANARATTRFINGPGYICGNPRPF